MIKHIRHLALLLSVLAVNETHGHAMQTHKWHTVQVLPFRDLSSFQQDRSTIDRVCPFLRNSQIRSLVLCIQMQRDKSLRGNDERALSTEPKIIIQRATPAIMQMQTTCATCWFWSEYRHVRDTAGLQFTHYYAFWFSKYRYDTLNNMLQTGITRCSQF
jgi:hypothetical protein